MGLTPPSAPTCELSGVSGQDFATVAARVLAYLQTSVGLDHWSLGRRQGTTWQVLSSTQEASLGLQIPWQDTLCAAVFEGGAPWATADVDAVPQLVAVRTALGIPLHSFVTVALPGADGSILGTLCGIAERAVSTDFEQWRGQLDLLASVLGALLLAELRVEGEARNRAAAELDAQTDPLTGLGTRRHWDHQLALEEQRCRRHGGGAAVLTVDVNGLKAVNDRWGHDAGDALLCQVARALRLGLREGDVIARLGGDEFAVLLAETTQAEAEAVERQLVLALEGAQLSAAVGMGVRGNAGLVQAWQVADARMYTHKRSVVHTDPPRPAGSGPLQAAVGSVLVEELLTLARRHTHADVAFLGRFEGDVRVMRAVDSGVPIPIGRGHVEPLSGTYCQRILDGRLPSAIPDTRLEPAALELPVTRALAIGGYLGVPVRLPDGRLYGSLCCVSHAPNAAFDDAAVTLMHSIASSLSRVLEAEGVEQAGRRAVLAELDGVVAGGRVHMVYQPVIELETGVVVGQEALARFEDSARPVDQWFAQAARVERTAELELHTACLALDEGAGSSVSLWFNLSASVLVSPAVGSLLVGRDLSRLVLEISEHEEVDDYEQLRRVLAPLRAQGLRLAVDDAGAGFSSLRHVLELSPDVIKLDISLVRGVAADPSRSALVAALVAFASGVGADVVAEGVETREELAALRVAGVRWGQGYLLGRPARPVRAAVPSPRAATPDGQRADLAG